MKTQKHYFSIGLFVLLGFGILSLACILFGGGKLFAKKLYFETYFPTSVEGLSIGSQVKFRGIPLGEVENITFTGAAYDEAANTSMMDREEMKKLAYVRVVCAIDVEHHPNVKSERLETMVKHGLRAKLTSAGITGGAFISLDFERDTALAGAETLTFPWTPEHLYIPSTPSTLQNVMNVVDEIAEQLKKIDFTRTTEAMNTLLETINTSIKDANVAELSASVNAVLQQLSAQLATLQGLLENVDGKGMAADLKTISGNLAQMSNELRTELPRLTQSANVTLQQMDATLQDVSAVLDQTSQSITSLQSAIHPDTMGEDIEETLSSLSRTTSSLEALVQEIRAKPSRLIFDDPLH